MNQRNAKNFAWLNPSRSLQTRLGLVFGSLTILLSLILSLMTSRQSEARIRHNVGRALEQMAIQLTGDLDRGMYDFYRETQNLASDPVLRDPDASLYAKQAVLEKEQRIYEDYLWIALVNKEGEVVVATNSMMRGADVQRTTWFNVDNRPDTPLVGDYKEVEFLSLLLVEPSRQSLNVLDLTVAWRDDTGELQGLVACYLDGEFIHERIADLMISAFEYEGLEIIITREDGTVMAGTSSLRVGSSVSDLESFRKSGHYRGGYLVETWSDDNEYLVGYGASSGFRDYDGVGWRVFVRKDSELAFAAADALGNQILATGVAMGLLFALLGAFMGHRMTRPMIDIAQAADCIRTGACDKPIPIVRGHDEMASLSKSLRALVDQLTHEIQERTRTEHQFRAIFENSPDVMVLINFPAAQMLMVNPAVNRILGYQPADLIGLPFVEVFPIDSDIRTEGRKHLLEFGFYSNQYDIRRRDGSEVAMDISITMIEWQGQPGILLVMRDVSEREQLQAIQLEADSMRSQMREAEDALKLKSMFVSIASHDLRNPLSTIMVSSDIIRKYGDRIPEDKRVGHFMRIETSINYMQQLLDDLMTIEKFETGKLLPEPSVLRLDEFCRMLMDEARNSTHADNDFVYSINAPAINLLLDPKLTRQAISNLLNNALKYSPEGQPIEFVVNTTPNHWLHVTIRDQGIGIPLADQERLYHTFHRASNVGDIHGTGLGLAITRRAVQALGGQIEFTSVEGSGTTFTVRLPYQALPSFLPAMGL